MATLTPSTERCIYETKFERYDREGRELAIAMEKLSSAIERLDERLDRADNSLEKIAEFTGKFEKLVGDIVRVENELRETQKSHKELDDRLDSIEHSIRLLKWVAGIMGGILAPVFGSFIQQWIGHLIGVGVGK